MITYRKYLILLLAGLLIVFKTHSQKATSTLSKNLIKIGEQVEFTIQFTGLPDYKVSFPVFSDTLTKNIEIIERTKIDSIYSEDRKELTLKQTFVISSFDSGYFAIKPLRFIYRIKKDTAKHYTETGSLFLTVNTIQVDTSKEIRDIKAPLEAPYTFKEFLPYILTVLLIAILVFAGIYIYRKIKKKEPIFQVIQKPKLPPHEVALKALEELRKKKLWQNNLIKEFHTELTDIIRSYLEDRFLIKALEMTSDEIYESIQSLNLDQIMKDKLYSMLNLADMVKFAKENPLPSEHDSSFNNAIDFVRNTIIVINDKDTNSNNLITN